MIEGSDKQNDIKIKYIAFYIVAQIIALIVAFNLGPTDGIGFTILILWLLLPIFAFLCAVQLSKKNVVWIIGFAVISTCLYVLTAFVAFGYWDYTRIAVMVVVVTGGWLTGAAIRKHSYAGDIYEAKE